MNTLNLSVAANLRVQLLKSTDGLFCQTSPNQKSYASLPLTMRQFAAGDPVLATVTLHMISMTLFMATITPYKNAMTRYRAALAFFISQFIDNRAAE
jgi:hypothetical protein